ncbi:SRPBCC family protein [Gordonia sp. L191]|uniref:SRPBCC family protein n=1 Tax=Gordonia sp. L191 TaxID=2982699 RepID=UPI0024BF1484|nr:SRPBCC family protein [Gordonia sp. L191]WHU47744.1 SRPBCC family protein [Gordonia sp. L191]
MPSTRSYTQFVALSPAKVWSVVGDVRRLPEWHSGYRVVSVEECSATTCSVPDTGARGSFEPARPLLAAGHRRLAPPFTLTRRPVDRYLQITQPEPAGVSVIEYRIDDVDGGCLVSETVTATAASDPIARLILSAVPHLTDRGDFTRLARLAGTVATDSLTVAIAGGSGALGRHLADLTCRGHRPVILTRHVNERLPYEQVVWDGRTVGAWARLFSDTEHLAVVNLAGKLVDCRPSRRQVAALRESRVQATRALVAASAGRPTSVSHWLQASTTAIWSDTGDAWCTENTPVIGGLPQMTGVAVPWELSVDGANADHVVIVRTSIVMDGQASAMCLACPP